MNNKNIRTIMTINRSRKMKKLILIAAMISAFTVYAAVPASAATMMDFQTSAQSALETVVTLIGGALGAWGVVNLLEGYGNDNPGAKSQGIKQAVAGVGLVLVGATIIPAIFSTGGGAAAGAGGN